MIPGGDAALTASLLVSADWRGTTHPHTSHQGIEVGVRQRTIIVGIIPGEQGEAIATHAANDKGEGWEIEG
jgi:hypothetical protein